MSEKSCNNCLHQKVCLDFGLITCERFENKDEWVHLLCKPRTRIYALGYSKRGYKHLIMNGEVYSVSINDRGLFMPCLLQRTSSCSKTRNLAKRYF